MAQWLRLFKANDNGCVSHCIAQCFQPCFATFICTSYGECEAALTLCMLVYYYMLKYSLMCAPAETPLWISQQPMFIEPCFDFSKTSLVADKDVCINRPKLHSELFQSVGSYRRPQHAEG